MSESSGHVVPYRNFVLTWLGLLVLTGVTIGASRFDFGELNVWIALTIASIKAGLVIFIFMHMQYERLYYRIYMFITLVILAIFIGLTFADVYYR